MNKIDFNHKFPYNKKIMDSLRDWSEKIREKYGHLQEKAGLAMLNRKPPNEFDDEEIAGCAAKIASPYDSMFSPTLEPRVSITMDENGYTITKRQSPSQINASFVWVTFAQLDEIAKVLPAHGYVKVDGKWQKA